MFERLQAKQDELTSHPLYTYLDTPEAVRTFMEHHVYAVWDFMTLLKALQRRLTCVDLPWRPSGLPSEAVRFINEIVLGEESDLDDDGNPTSHYEMYLQAMREVGADTETVSQFVRSLNMDLLPAGVRPFVEHNLKLAEQGTHEEVAAAFLYGREKLIPEMFSAIVGALDAQAERCPKLMYYLERHIELDGDEHGPMAERLLAHLVGDDPMRHEWAEAAGLRALDLRHQLWDTVIDRIPQRAERRRTAGETA